MTKTKNENRYAVIAGVCFALLEIYNIIVFFIYNDVDYSFNFQRNFYRIIRIGFAISLFLKNKAMVAIVSGVFTLLNTYELVSDIHEGGFALNDFYSIYEILNVLSCSFFLIVIIMALTKKEICKKIWFIPCSLLFISEIFNWIYSFIYYNLWEYGLEEWIWVFLLKLPWDIIIIIGLLFIGMWIKENDFQKNITPINEYATFHQEAVNYTDTYSDVVGGADKLKNHKKLLDAGIITQEEFDKKKKEIL